MKYLRDNKCLFLNYIYIFISNILVYILSNFYFRNIEYKDLIMLLIVVVIDYFIFLKYKSKFILYFDFIINFLIGLLLMLFSKDNLSYATSLFSIVFANNIVFVKSRVSDKILKKNFQYFMAFINTMLILFFNLCVFYFI